MGQRLVITINSNSKRIANCYYHWSGYTGSALDITLKALQAGSQLSSNLPPIQKAIRMLEATGATLKISDYPAVYGHPVCIEDFGLKGDVAALFAKLGVALEDFTDDDKLEATAEKFYAIRPMFGGVVVAMKPDDGNEFGLSEEELTLLCSLFARVNRDRNDGLIDVGEKEMDNSQSWSEMDVIIDLDTMTADLGDAFFYEQSAKEYRKNRYVEKGKKLHYAKAPDSYTMDAERLEKFLKTYKQETVYRNADGSVTFSLY